MTGQQTLGTIGAIMIAVAMLAEPAEAAARCRNTGSFERWLDGFKREAAAQGISRQAIAADAIRTACGS
jgi:membrane-bound lytic murein transglycosylase B